MTYLLGGYYLMRLRPVTFGTFQGQQILTCSNCINDSLLDGWSYTSTTRNNKDLSEACAVYDLNEQKVVQLQDWADNALNAGKIGWVNLFTDLDAAKAYRDKFFRRLPDVYIMALYFDEHEAGALHDAFKPTNAQQGSIGLYHNLLRRLPELVTSDEQQIGYDIIGIELDGSFHSFHCHDLSDGLAEKFNIQLNAYGLYDSLPDSNSITAYMNDEANGFEPVPWFIVKTKLITT